ncbi:hypothetical protein AAF712_015781 [Marasmius tenuissimus]|uniref:Uncharacterized protein n=1 Tax=Marasmius tenuissimus TaxID=585030 RepID=A0ABR2Z7B2_9AGAR
MVARTPSKQARLAPYPTPPSTPYSLRPGPREAETPAIEHKLPTPQASAKSNLKGTRRSKGGGKKMEQLRKGLMKCRQENERKDKQLEAVLLEFGALEAKTARMREEVELLRELRPTAVRASEIADFHASNLEDHYRLVNRQKCTSRTLEFFSLLVDVILAGSTAVTLYAATVRRRGDPMFEEEEYPGKPAGPFDVYGKVAEKTWLWDLFTTGFWMQ